VELQTVVDELPSGDNGAIVPVVLPTNGVGIVPSGTAGISAVDVIVAVDDVIMAALPPRDVVTAPGAVDDVGTGAAVMDGGGRGGIAGGGGAGMVEPKIVDANDVAGCADSVSSAVVLLAVDVEEATGAADIAGVAEIDDTVPVVAPVASMEVTGTAGIPIATCPVGTEHVTTVPGVVGSEASGTGANVVSGVPGWVVAENGLGPLSGDVTIAPGVDGRPMAVVPMVETCARLALQPASRMAVVNSRCRIAVLPSAPS
jgi:hypothetical protein